MSEASAPFFSPAQRRLVGFAVGLFAFLAIVSLLVLVVVVLGRLVGLFSHVIWPLAVAGIMALILRPLVSVFERWLRLSRLGSVIVLYGLVTAALAGVLIIFLPGIVTQIIDFINGVPELWTRASATIARKFPEWQQIYTRAMENELLRKVVEGGAEQARNLAAAILPNLASAGGTVVGAVGFVTSLAVVPVYLFFFLLSDDDPTRGLPENLPFLKAETRANVIFLIREFISIVVAFFRGQLLIGLIMGVLLAVGFSLVGLEFGAVFGFVAGLLNIVPYLGTILGLSAVLPTAFFQTDGSLLTAAMCLGVFVLVQLIEGYFLTPRIMGRQTGLHPVAIIIAIFFWGTALGGILGMVLAIPLTAFLVTAWRFAKHRYMVPVA